MRVSHIQREVADAFNMPVRIMTDKTRTRGACDARHAAMWLSRRILSTTLSQLANAFQRDYTTIGYGLERAGAMMASHPDYKARVMRLRRQLGDQCIKERGLGTDVESIIHEAIDQMMPAFVDSVIEGVMRRIKK